MVCAIWDKQLLSVCTNRSAIVFPCVWLAKQSLGFNATRFPSHSLISWKEASLCLEQQQEKTQRSAGKGLQSRQTGSSSIPKAPGTESCNSHNAVNPTASEEPFKASSEMDIATKSNNTKCFSFSVESKSTSKCQHFAVLVSNFYRHLGYSF